jgi:hypothetical protein
VAWLIEAGWVSGPQAWVARYKKLSHGPCSLNEAKKAVLAMIGGKFAGFVAEVVKDPIGHMNSTQALLIAREAAADPVTLVGSDHWSRGSGIDNELRAGRSSILNAAASCVTMISPCLPFVRLLDG